MPYQSKSVPIFVAMKRGYLIGDGAFIALMVFFVVLLFGYTKVVGQSDNRSGGVRTHISYQGLQNKSTLRVIKELSHVLLTDISKVIIPVDYTSALEVASVGDTALQIMISGQVYPVNQEFLYRNFDLCDLLNPDEVVLGIKMNEELSRQDIPLEFSIPIGVDGEFSLDTTISFLSFSGRYFPEQSIGAFHYKEEKIALLKLSLSQIDSYYAIIDVLNYLQKEIRSIDLRYGGRYPEALIRLAVSQCVVDCMEKIEDENKFVLSRGDPQRILSVFASLNYQITSLKEMIGNEPMAKYAFQSRQIDQLARIWVDEYLHYPRMANDASFRSLPVFQRLIHYPVSVKCLSAIQNILDLGGLDNNEKVRFFQKLSGLLQQEGLIMLEKGLFNDAAGLFQFTVSLSDSLGYRVYSDELPVLCVRAYYGVFNSFARVASHAIDARRPELASRYINNAKEYMSRHSDVVNGKATIIRLYTALCKLYLQMSDNALLNGNCNQSLMLLSRVDSIQKMGDVIIAPLTTDSLRNNALAKLLECYFVKAEKELYHGNPMRADTILKQGMEGLRQYTVGKMDIDRLNLLQQQIDNGRFLWFQDHVYYAMERNDMNEAFQIISSIDGEFLRSPVYRDSLVRLKNLVMLPWLKDKIKFAALKIWAGQFTEAAQLYRHMENVIGDMNYTPPRDIDEALTGIFDNSVAVLCVQYGKMKDKKMSEASFFLAKGKYYLAEQILNEVPLNTGDCSETVNTRLVLDSIARQIAIPAEYQRLITKLSDAISVCQYDEAINLYLDIVNYYDSYRLERWHLERFSANDLIEMSKDKVLMVCGNLVEKGLFIHAFEIMSLLDESGFRDNEQWKKMQATTGKVLARKFEAQNEIDNAKKYLLKFNVKKYTLKGVVYSYFRELKNINQK